MFKEIEDGIIESSEGYRVNTHEHFRLSYTEGDHVAWFYKEPGVGGYIHYLGGAVRWDPPFETEAIPLEQQERIKDRIVAALRFRGYPVHIQR